MKENKIIETFHEGHCIEAYRLFGAHVCEENHLFGVRFTVYAPHARNISSAIIMTLGNSL